LEDVVSRAAGTRVVDRTMGVAIVLSVAMSAGLYVLVVTIAVLAVGPQTLAESDAPLCAVVNCERGAMAAFAPIAVIATLNGVLIEIVLMSRVAYGMARRGWLPKTLARVHAKRRTPLLATMIVGAVVFTLTTLVSFEPLARLTSTLLLMIFAVVNLSLIRLKRSQPDAVLTLRIPLWVPVLGVISCAVLLGAEIVHIVG